MNITIRDFMAKDVDLYEQMSQSDEAYFGPNSPLATHINVCFKNIFDNLSHDLVDSIREGNMSYRKAKGKFDKAVMVHFKKLEKQIEEDINVEKVSIGIIYDENAFTIPFVYDAKLYDKNKKDFNDKLLQDYSDIIETKGGYKFKTKHGKILTIAFGFGFLDYRKGYTPEECSAIFLHELGHNFQHMLNSIRVMLADENVSQSLQDIVFTGSIFGFIGLGILYPLFAISSLLHITGTRDFKKWKTSILAFFKNLESREKIVKQVEKECNSGAVIKIINEEYNVKNPIIKFILFVFKSAFMPIVAIGQFFFNVVDMILPGGRFQLAVIGKKNFDELKKYEQFADYFVTNYGFGEHLASAFKKITLKGSSVIDMGAMNWLHYVPLVNIAIDGSALLSDRINAKYFGYSESHERVANVSRSLRRELAQNDDLTPAQKKEIIKQIEIADKEYEKIMKDTGSRNFLRSCILRIQTKGKGAKKGYDKTLDANVLDVMLGTARDVADKSDEKDIVKKVNKSVDLLGGKSALIISNIKSFNSKGFLNLFKRR